MWKENGFKLCRLWLTEWGFPFGAYLSSATVRYKHIQSCVLDWTFPNNDECFIDYWWIVLKIWAASIRTCIAGWCVQSLARCCNNCNCGTLKTDAQPAICNSLWYLIEGKSWIMMKNWLKTLPSVQFTYRMIHSVAGRLPVDVQGSGCVANWYIPLSGDSLLCSHWQLLQRLSSKLT